MTTPARPTYAGHRFPAEVISRSFILRCVPICSDAHHRLDIARLSRCVALMVDARAPTLIMGPRCPHTAHWSDRRIICTLPSWR
ncbi:MAG: hypothetical protein ACJ8AW_29750 [Rhodopila sp.]